MLGLADINLGACQTISRVSPQMLGQELGPKMKLLDVLAHAKWATLTKALPHACQQLIRRGAQKPLECHELANPLEAVSKV